MIKRRYDKIIELMCEYKGISRKELCKLLKDKKLQIYAFSPPKKIWSWV